ncbi:hypothetical protein M8J76_005117 [Diaphorina citri]|nr:hypothetical protein M8J76_005117 [Diaphorina citri]
MGAKMLSASMLVLKYTVGVLVLVSFCVQTVQNVPVIKMHSQLFNTKLDPGGGLLLNSDFFMYNQPRHLASLIGTGTDPVHPSPAPKHKPPSRATTVSDKTRATLKSDHPKAKSDTKKAEKSDTKKPELRKPEKAKPDPKNRQPKRREDVKLLEPPGGMSPELFALLQQYHAWTRPDDERQSEGPGTEKSGGFRMAIFPRHRSADDVIQPIRKSDESLEDISRNVQKIERKPDGEKGAKDRLKTLQESVDAILQDMIGREDEGSEPIRTNTTNQGSENDDTVMEKVRQTDIFAIVYLGGFIGLVTFFFILACSEIFCQNCLYRSASSLFLPQAQCTHSYYSTPKPVTPPPPYHLFAPPQYMDIVKDFDSSKANTPGLVRIEAAKGGKMTSGKATSGGKMTSSPNPCGCACPSYNSAMQRAPQAGAPQRTNLVSIINLDDQPCPPYQVTPAAAAYLNIINENGRDVRTGNVRGKGDGGNWEKSSTGKRTGEETYKVHRIPTEMSVCGCRTRESDKVKSIPKTANLVKHSLSFIERTAPQTDSTFKNSVSFTEPSYIERHFKTSPTEKIESHFSPAEKMNDVDRTALSSFQEDSKQFKQQLKTRIRNSLSFSASPNCTDQLVNQVKHSVSYTERINAVTSDDHLNLTNLKQCNSCFALRSHSSLITLPDTSTELNVNAHRHQRFGNNRDEHKHSGLITVPDTTEVLNVNAHRHQRFGNNRDQHTSGSVLNKNSLAGNLLDTSLINLSNETFYLEDAPNNRAPRHKTESGNSSDANTDQTNTCPSIDHNDQYNSSADSPVESNRVDTSDTSKVRTNRAAPDNSNRISTSDTFNSVTSHTSNTVGAHTNGVGTHTTVQILESNSSSSVEPNSSSSVEPNSAGSVESNSSSSVEPNSTGSVEPNSPGSVKSSHKNLSGKIFFIDDLDDEEFASLSYNLLNDVVS